MTINQTQDEANLTPLDEVVEDLEQQDEQESTKFDAVPSSEDEQEVDEDSQDEVEEDVITLGDEVLNSKETDPFKGEKAPQWVKDLRQELRTAKKRERELEKKLEEVTKVSEPAKPTLSLGAKPKIEDFDYDPDAYENALDGWYLQKKMVELQEVETRAQKEAEAREWSQKIATYEQKKAALKVKDFSDAEAVVLANLSETQQGIILNGADNPALLVYALGKNEAKAKELAKTTDLVKFAFNVAKMESQLKVTQKRIPEPEKIVGGSGGNAVSITTTQNSRLEKLEAEALRTGDRSKVVAFKKAMQQKT